MIFRDISIRRKLALLTLAATICALLLACIGFAIYERSRFRADITREATTLAETLGANAAASLAFKDQKSATEILNALQAEHQIITACLYDENGAVFAQYTSNGQKADCVHLLPLLEGVQARSNVVTVFKGVFLAHERTGTIAITAELNGFGNQLLAYSRIATLVFLLSLGATFIVSRQLLRIVTDPILQLSEAAASVSHQKDYSLRVRRKTNDEIGYLIDSFNHMLEV